MDGIFVYVKGILHNIGEMIQKPVVGMILGSGVTTLSLKSWLEFGTTVMGFIGASCGALVGMISVYFWILKVKKESNAKKENKRRSTDQ